MITRKKLDQINAGVITDIILYPTNCYIRFSNGEDVRGILTDVEIKDWRLSKHERVRIRDLHVLLDFVNSTTVRARVTTSGFTRDYMLYTHYARGDEEVARTANDSTSQDGCYLPREYDYNSPTGL